MNSRHKYLFKNVGILTISNFASKILVFLLVPLYTSILSTSEVGICDIVTTTVYFLCPIMTLNVADAVMRFLVDGASDKSAVMAVGIKYVGMSWIICGTLIFGIYFLNLFPRIEDIYLFFFFFYVLYTLYQLLIQIAKGIEKVLAIGIAGILSTISMIIGNVVFLVIFRTGLKGFLLSHILAQLIPDVYLLLCLDIKKYIHRYRINNTLKREMINYSMPLIATAIGWWVNNAADKYIVAMLCGVAANGLLSISYKIPSIINTFQQVFIQAWQISAVKEYGSFYGQTFLILNIYISIICSGLILLSKPIGHVLFKKSFFDAWRYVPFLLIASVINSASGFLGAILSAKKTTKPMAASAVYGIGSNILLNFLFVSLVGVQGATIATVVSSFVIFQVRKSVIGDELQINNFRNAMSIWILLCLEAILEIYTTFWVGEIIVFLIIFIFNRKLIIQSIRSIKNN